MSPKRRNAKEEKRVEEDRKAMDLFNSWGEDSDSRNIAQARSLDMPLSRREQKKAEKAAAKAAKQERSRKEPTPEKGAAKAAVPASCAAASDAAAPKRSAKRVGRVSFLEQSDVSTPVEAAAVEPQERSHRIPLSAASAGSSSEKVSLAKAASIPGNASSAPGAKEAARPLNAFEAAARKAEALEADRQEAQVREALQPAARTSGAMQAQSTDAAKVSADAAGAGVADETGSVTAGDGASADGAAGVSGDDPTGKLDLATAPTVHFDLSGLDVAAGIYSLDGEDVVYDTDEVDDEDYDDNAASIPQNAADAAFLPSPNFTTPEGNTVEAGTPAGAKRRRKRIRVSTVLKALLAAVILAVIGICSYAVWSFTENRWHTYDDAQDFVGSWRIDGTSFFVVFTEDKIVLSEDVAYNYEVDPQNKIIEISFGSMEGNDYYRFSQDRDSLLLVDNVDEDNDLIDKDFWWYIKTRIAEFDPDFKVEFNDLENAILLERLPGTSRREQANAPDFLAPGNDAGVPADEGSGDGDGSGASNDAVPDDSAAAALQDGGA